MLFNLSSLYSLGEIGNMFSSNTDGYTLEYENVNNDLRGEILLYSVAYYKPITGGGSLK